MIAASIIGEPSAAKGGLIAVGAVVAMVVYARVDIRRHPNLPCRTCGGSSRSRSAIRGEATGPCPRCRGKGRRGKRRLW